MRGARATQAPHVPPAGWALPVVGVAVAVLVVGLVGSGSGYVNGDAAAYAAQGWQGDLRSRPVHLGYTGLAAALAPLAGASLPRWLDAVSALACAGAALAAGRYAATLRDRVPWVAALLTGALLLPIASFAEVDALWIALIAGAAAVRHPAAAAGLAGAAVLVSPLALIGVWWASSLRWRRAIEGARGSPEAILDLRGPNNGLWAVPFLVVVVVSLWSGLEWWSGDRGVLSAPAPRPWRAIQAWTVGAVPWFSLPLVAVGFVAGGGAAFLVAAILLLAPPDTAAWGLFAISFALMASRGARVVRGWGPLGVALVALVALDVARGGWRWSGEVARVRHEDATIRRVLDAMGPNDGLVAPWTFGVRASVIAKGDPYALAWRVPGPPVRDPAPWCNRTFTVVHRLPPDLVLPAGPLPGCPSVAAEEAPVTPSP